MSYQLFNVQPEPLAAQRRPSPLEIEQYEIMSAVRQARARERYERRALKRVRRDIRRMERQTRREPIAEQQPDHERV